MRSPRRSAYTLFQLLVVVALIALLIGILLPAVQQVRMAAARTQSQNNLRYLGIGFHSYSDTNGKLPAGVDGKNFSALAHLLPYIEQENLARRLDKTKSIEDPANAVVRSVTIKVFISPLDTVGPTASKFGPTNYQAVAGSQSSLAGNDGAFYENSAQKITEFNDGTSNTVWLVESLRGDGGTKAESVSRQHVLLKKEDLKGLKEEAGVQDFKDDKNIVGTRGGSWLDGRYLQATTSFTRGFNDAKPDVDCGGAGGHAAPRSLLPGTSAAFADGSVRFISDKVKPAIWKALATRNGGEVIPNDL